MLNNALLVELIDYSAIVLFSLMTLDFHGVCHYALSLEGLWLQVDIFGLLEALQTCILADFSKIIHNLETNGFVLAELLEATLDIQLLADFLDCLAIRDSNGNDKGFSRLTMNVNFCQFIALHISILHLFRSYILTLLQLEYVLFPVDDAQCPCLSAQ